MAVGSTSLSSGAGITINIGGGAEAANSATGDTAGTDAIQADIQKLVEDLQKLSGSNATSGANSASGSDKGGKSAKSHAPGQEKKADKAQNDQNSKLMDLLSKILQVFAQLLGGGKNAGADTGSSTSGSQQGVAPGEQNGSGTVINVNTK